jgi:hypothetical protein
MKNDLTKIYKKYKGLWVALKDDWKTVISSNEDVEIAQKEAIEKGYKSPIMFKVPSEIIGFVGTP